MRWSLKVLLINARYAPDVHGGAEKSVQSLAEALARRGHLVSVLATAGQTVAETTEQLNGVRVVRIPSRNLYFDTPEYRRPVLKRLGWHLMDLVNPLQVRPIQKIISREQPDVVHTNALEGLSAAAWIASRSLNVPVVHTPRSYYLMCPRASMVRGGANCSRQCQSCRVFTSPRRIASSRVNAVVGISQFILNRHLQAGYFSQASAHVIPNSYDSSASAPERSEASAGLLRLGYIGRLHATKGVDWLIKRLRTLGASGWSLTLAGNGEPKYEAQLREIAQGLPVKFLGFADPSRLLSQVDSLIVPSLWEEPFGRVVIESYAHGVPVIASSRGGIAELIRHGETGFIFEPDRPEEIDSILGQLLAEPSRIADLRQRALAEAPLYTSQAVAGQYESVYERVIQSTRLRIP